MSGRGATHEGHMSVSETAVTDSYVRHAELATALVRMF
jgi:hypothetical protein